MLSQSERQRSVGFRSIGHFQALLAKLLDSGGPGRLGKFVNEFAALLGSGEGDTALGAITWRHGDRRRAGCRAGCRAGAFRRAFFLAFLGSLLAVAAGVAGVILGFVAHLARLL